MRKPVSHYKVVEVQRLVKIGVSAREAARRVGMSNRTASKIANGEHVSQFSETDQLQTVAEYECPTCRRIVNTAPCPTCLARRGR